jgi:hypothetical protein
VILQADRERQRGELILGDLNAATDLELLEQHDVKTIITAAAGLEHLEIPPEQTHIVFPLLDLKNESIETYFELSYQTIELSNFIANQISSAARSWSTAGLASPG